LNKQAGPIGRSFHSSNEKQQKVWIFFIRCMKNSEQGGKGVNFKANLK
jgi:hypothetical protein